MASGGNGRGPASVGGLAKFASYIVGMKKIDRTLEELSDREIVSEVKRLAVHEQRATADLVATLAEFDARRLYLGEGRSSLFTYCTEVLHLSEHASYHRIEAARAVRRFPLILERLAEGALTLTAVRLLSPHLTAEMALIQFRRHFSKGDYDGIDGHKEKPHTRTAQLHG